MEPSKNKYQRAIYSILQDHPIAYSPRLSMVLKSINASILLAQLLYWRGKGAYGEWVYKTIEDMAEETGMSRSEQDTAIRKCKEKGVLKTVRKGIPARRFFLIDMERLVDLVDEWAKSNPQVLKIDPLSIAGLKQTITETTTGNTHENTSPKRIRIKKKLRKNMNVEIKQSIDALVNAKNMAQ